MKENRKETGLLDRDDSRQDAVRNHRSREERVAGNFENKQHSLKNEQRDSCCSTNGNHKNGWQSGSDDGLC